MRSEPPTKPQRHINFIALCLDSQIRATTRSDPQTKQTRNPVVNISSALTTIEAVKKASVLHPLAKIRFFNLKAASKLKLSQSRIFADLQTDQTEKPCQTKRLVRSAGMIETSYLQYLFRFEGIKDIDRCLPSPGVRRYVPERRSGKRLSSIVQDRSQKQVNFPVCFEAADTIMVKVCYQEKSACHRVRIRNSDASTVQRLLTRRLRARLVSLQFCARKHGLSTTTVS